MSERNEETTLEKTNPAAIIDDADNSCGAADAKDSQKCDDETQIPSQKQEDEVVKKKYGGLLPKKIPLISKDNERAFFDSADWALGKVGAQKSKGPLEALLRPKLQPTQNQHLRSRSAYARADGVEDGCEFDDTNTGENHDESIDNHSLENQNLEK
ncbi:hypothetical protein ABFS82_05G007700 [Erythranthe guttata]|uniref:Endosulphine n=2 Tax=Erythranthe guttata TaxID=4155 RepID=A0A022Q7B7_ERYGU|nr:PREDICTED: uncharacterized protein LOC105974625 isoform X2 [Erythranthe guttata]XP_012855194.1 PREDICTED: uncharacterized protein LOC105974625 isoform X2 [Erythranthe guttata]EYU22405.1 hypothetical protein MIMGU_mgv1a015506mg [Erythranthe guttata]|eukprot:XP_012855193.1 PREDICTED: uncharacterized protein LOC105974625 isoform X2 [Erythranthe guttata]